MQPERKQPKKQPQQTAPLPASATEDSPSRCTTQSNGTSSAAMSSVASTEETAIHDNSFHSDPGQDEIKYSDNESEYTNNTDDAEEDHGDGKDDGEYEDTHGEEENFDNTDNEDKHENDYSELLDSSLLEDEELSVSYRVDWVKGKGAGRKPNKGRPPRSH
jgi:hypothetical protein